MEILLTFSCMVAMISVVSCNYYCRMSCKDYQANQIIKHIGCNHNNLFDQYNCPSNAEMVPITNCLKSLLVDAHNIKRNFIAGGGDRNHRPACRMATMKWDNELAKLAALNVMQCNVKHDKCHNTRAFQSSGQNLAMVWQSPPYRFNSAIMLRKAVNSWFSEVRYSNQNIIDSYPAYYSGPAIGHFTVMMRDQNVQVGCAASTYTIGDKRYFLTACNYATTNIINKPVYARCKYAAKYCKTNTNPFYPNLCSEHERYDLRK